MDENQLNSFFAHVEQLTQQYQLLKQHAFQLHELNQDLLHENKQLKNKSAMPNSIAKKKVERS